MGRRKTHRGFSLLEMLVVLAIIGILLSVLMPALARARESARRATCQGNLKQWALVFKMYSAESPAELWPPMQFFSPNAPGSFFEMAAGPRVSAVVPEYVTDSRIVVCPSASIAVDEDLLGANGIEVLTRNPRKIGTSYAYFGWIFDKANEDAVRAAEFPDLVAAGSYLGFNLAAPFSLLNAQMLAALDAAVRESFHPAITPLQIQQVLDGPIDGVSPHPRSGMPLGNGTSNTLLRLAEGVERFLVTDVNDPAATAVAQSGIWAMFDTATSRNRRVHLNHSPGGSNVLYMDGHVSYVPYIAARWSAADVCYRDAGATEPVSISVAYTLDSIVGRSS